MAQTFLVPADFSANVNPFSQTVIAINPDGTAIGGGGGSSTVSLTGTSRAVALSSSSGNQTIAAGKKYIQIIFSDDFIGTVGGVAFTGEVDASWDITAPPGDTLGSVAVTRSAGSYRVTTIT